jgi:hypothetical protein
MSLSRTFLVAVAGMVSFAAYLAADDHGDEGFQTYPLTAIEWKSGPPSLPPGAQIAVLEGDPSKEGPFVFRVKVPDGYRIPVHTHPKTERVTVIAGTFNIGMGDTVRPARNQTDASRNVRLLEIRDEAFCVGQRRNHRPVSRRWPLEDRIRKPGR